MDLGYLCLLIGLLVLLIFSIIENIIFGDRGKKNISDLFRLLKGEKKVKGQKKIDTKNTANSLDKLARRYMYYAFPICVLIFFIAFLAFKSMFMAILISLFGFIFPKAAYNNALRKRRELVELQLRDALNSITSSLKAGLSINSALIKCYDELERIYISQKEKPMLDEFRKIRNDLNMGMSVDDVLRNFKDRVKTEDAEDFVQSIIIVRLKGGNLVEVVDNVSRMITDKINIKREIDRLTSGKKMEAKILSFIPVFIVVSLSLFSPKYMQPLYGTGIGKIIILFGFVLLTINYFIGRKIADIQV